MASLKTLWAEFKAFAFKGNMIDLAIAVVIGGAFSGVIDSLVKDIIMPTISYATAAVKEAKDATVKATESAMEATGIATTQPATTQPTTQPMGASTEPAATTQPAEAAPATQATDVANQLIAAKSKEKSQQWQEMVSAFATALEADRKAADAKADKDKEEAAAKAAAEKPVDLSWKIGRINLGNFIGALINFLIIALAVFIIMVKVLGGVMKRAGGTPAPAEKTTKECPECLSIIPIKARRCPQCTSPQPMDTTPTV